MGEVRWAVVGTANIAARAFLPAMREAGGRAIVVGSRSAERAAAWAADNQVERGGTYAEALAADVDAIYVALPNDQHAEWAAAACAGGPHGPGFAEPAGGPGAPITRAVLCEKPLTLDADTTSALIAAAGPRTGLWEAFVFPFHPQTELIRSLIAGGELGELREIVSEFHFTVGRPDNIRLRPEHGGGALYDVGCYPIRLARLLFGAEPLAATGSAFTGPTGVDLDTAGVLDFPGDRRLVFSAGLRRSASTATRIIGTDAELRVSNPFHPSGADTVELWAGGAVEKTWPAGAGTAFRHAIGHIHRVLRDGATPRFLAADDSVAQAKALDLLRAVL